MSPEKSRFLPEHQAARWINAYEIAYPEHRVAITAEDAVTAAEAIGYPVVLKMVADVVHKSDVGGVVTGLSNADQVRAAYTRIRAEAAAHAISLTAVLVCRHIEPGIELIVGGFRDGTFGPTVMAGLGGVFTEVLDDVAFRVAPIDTHEAERLLREIRGWALLEGIRGNKRGDIEGCSRLLANVSRMMVEQPKILSLDLNPVRVLPNAVVALDVQIEVKSRLPSKD